MVARAQSCVLNDYVKERIRSPRGWAWLFSEERKSAQVVVSQRKTLWGLRIQSLCPLSVGQVSCFGIEVLLLVISRLKNRGSFSISKFSLVSTQPSSPKSIYPDDPQLSPPSPFSSGTSISHLSDIFYWSWLWGG